MTSGQHRGHRNECNLWRILTIPRLAVIGGDAPSTQSNADKRVTARPSWPHILLGPDIRLAQLILARCQKQRCKYFIPSFLRRGCSNAGPQVLPRYCVTWYAHIRHTEGRRHGVVKSRFSCNRRISLCC